MTSWLVGLFIGTALAIAFAAIFGLVRDLGSADATYRDRPPLGFRLAWPLVNVMANTFGFLLSEKRAADVQAKLHKGGQAYALTPHQFFGGQITGALVFGSTILLLVDSPSLVVVLGATAFGFMYPVFWLNDHTKKRNLAILKALPFLLDIITLSIESGLNLTGALAQAVDKCKPGPLVVEVNRVLRDVRAGKPRLDALRELAERLDFAPVSSLVSALVQGELMGSSLGPILRAQSDQRRTERFQRAEKLAMEAPVKMLGPLILFIFPCTFIMLGFPIVMKFLASGI